MKEYSSHVRNPELGPHHKMQFNVIPKKPLLLRGLILLQRVEPAYYNLHRLGCKVLMKTKHLKISRERLDLLC